MQCVGWRLPAALCSSGTVLLAWMQGREAKQELAAPLPAGTTSALLRVGGKMPQILVGETPGGTQGEGMKAQHGWEVTPPGNARSPQEGLQVPASQHWGPRVTQEGPGGQLKAITDFPHNPSAQTGLAPRTDPSPSSSGTHLGKASNQ